MGANYPLVSGTESPGSPSTLYVAQAAYASLPAASGYTEGTAAWANDLDCAVYTVGSVWVADFAGAQAISSVVYGAYGVTSMTIGGYAYTFTYSAGKIATATGAGKTKTYTWSGDDLVSVVVS